MNSLLVTSATALRDTLQLSMTPADLLDALEAMVFRARSGSRGPTDGEKAACMMVASAYGLNPFRNEIYMIPTEQGYKPYVPIDGWAVIAQNKHDGIGFEYESDGSGHLVSCTCEIWVRGCSRPVRVTEYLSECRRNSPAWRSERRMLRHRAFMQACRIAFGVSGVWMDDDSVADAVPPAVDGAKRLESLIRGESNVAESTEQDQVEKPRQEECEVDEEAEEAASLVQAPIPTGGDRFEPSPRPSGAKWKLNCRIVSGTDGVVRIGDKEIRQLVYQIESETGRIIGHAVSEELIAALKVASKGATAAVDLLLVPKAVGEGRYMIVGVRPAT